MRFGSFHHHKIHMLRSAFIVMAAVVVASLSAAPLTQGLEAQDVAQEPTTLARSSSPPAIRSWMWSRWRIVPA
jgi:hypothetical protein